MNPAVLVILWIRLSVTFGYPATLRDIQTISKIFGDTQVSKGTIDTFDQSLSEPPTHTSPFNLIIRRIRGDDTGDGTSSTSSTPTPHRSNDDDDDDVDDNNLLQPSQQQRIISIVRVSSTSVVKPKIVVHKSNEMSVSVKSKNKTVDKFENLVTPFVSLLRKNRLDVDEDVPKFAALATSSSTASFSSSSSILRHPPSASSTTSAPTSTTFSSQSHRNSKSTYNGTDDLDQDYVDDTTARIMLQKHTLATAAAFDETYDETDPNETDDQQPAGAAPESAKMHLYDGDHSKPEPERIYGEPERVYGEPERVYGEPERVYGEPERVYGEPERVYGEPEKNYEESEKPYKPDDIVANEPPENVFDKHDESNDFKLPEGSADKNPAPVPAKSYASYTTKLNDKKSSYIVDNGTYRKYRVEEKTADGFIVGEYGMVSHQDGSLRGVRYTADSNINPSLIYETLVKFLSLK